MPPSAPAPPRPPADGAAARPDGGVSAAALPPGPAWLHAGVVAVVVVAGVVLRFTTRSDLWLDEALSANIAQLPIGDLLEALRRDGHPPLYYLLLHGWSSLVGTGDVAVRALSGLFAVAALPVAWWAGRRYAGRFGGVVALVLFAVNPFVTRYATETRMYTLVMLLVLVGWLAASRAMESPSIGRLAVVALVSGALLLTHYWAFYLLGAVGLLLVWRVIRAEGPDERRTALRVGLAIGAGGVLFLPWLPSFLSQLESTGTPWGTPSRPGVMVMSVLRDYGGTVTGESDLIGFVLALLALVAVFGRPGTRGRIELDLRPRRATRAEAQVLVGTLAIGAVAGYATRSAFATRYSAMVFPILLLLIAYGIALFPRRVGGVLLALLAVAGLGGSVVVAATERTQSGRIAAAIEERHEPGDVVVYCPDQLGPGVSRYLPPEMHGLTYPERGDPRFVDWVDYEATLAGADPASFARSIADEAPDGSIFLVWFGGYRTHQGTCERLINELATDRPAEQLVVAEADIFEPASLYRYAPPAG